MFRHDLRIAFQSIRQNPFIAALIVAVIAVGIGTSVVAITLYHSKAGNPIWWKNDVLFRVMLDSRPAPHEADVSQHPEYPPFTLIYRDAAALYQSRIPTRSALMVAAYAPVSSPSAMSRPFNRAGRLTTREFFSMFDVPFLYGHAWSKSDDEGPSQVAVISRALSERLFGAGDSVGRTLVFSGQTFQVVGVTDRWMPLPRFYDVGRSFIPSDDLFIPFRWADSLSTLHFPGFCARTQTSVTTFKELAPSECIFVGLWVELSSTAQFREYRKFLDNYAREQQQARRFERPLNNRLANVSTWLVMNDVIGSQTKFQVVLALVFLGICILNTLGLLLAKFMSRAPLVGLRRALGATRGDIVRQHLTEVMVLGAIGGAIGIGLAIVGLRLVRIYFFMQSNRPGDNPEFASVAQSLSHLDGRMILIAVGLSLLAGLLAGVYPAWRIGRMAPATFLKIQ
ncbi:MAG TPA: ABC transporter permease [Steroidobacteraceae bacterium]|nr:ABC transporter permease [Steroidobacteraceae bacterium]